MRALSLLQRILNPGLDFMHSRRRNSLWLAVGALLIGGKLWLTALGRHRPGKTCQKYAIKAINRLLGNKKLHKEMIPIYRSMTSLLLRGSTAPVVLVDITEIRTGVCALTAAVAVCGRSVPIYGLVRRKKTISKARTQSVFLKHLKSIVPEECVPIIVTDAGFESPWFNKVSELGWNYIGRVRHRTRFFYDDTWASAQDLHTEAKNRPRDLGLVAFPRRAPEERRLVLSKRWIGKGRCRKNSAGRKGKTANDKRCEKSAHEPWLLATSLKCCSKQIVEFYSFRMQIEQNYRDTKSLRWGWQLSLSKSFANQRLEVLLLIAALGTIATLSVGAIAEHLAHHRKYQANTTEHRRVLSWFFLGCQIIVHSDPFLTQRRTAQGIQIIRSKIKRLE